MLLCLFAWPVKVMHSLITSVPPSDLHASILYDSSTTVGTNFSGIGTVEQGFAYLKNASVTLGVPIPAAHVVSGDVSKTCRSVLKHLGKNKVCVHGNILDRTSLSSAKFCKLRTVHKKIKAMKKRK